MAYLGIDLGTSGLRALLVGMDGIPIGAAERHLEVVNSRFGWSEQDPAAWIEALEGAVAELRSMHPAFAELRGIGVSGQMHGATLLDRDDVVIRPCILWNDTRSHAEAAILDKTDGMRARSGNIVFPGFTAPKLEWLRKYEPENHARTAKVLLPAGFINHYLIGEHVADMSDSAGTAWLDVGSRRWSDENLRHGHMRADQMPRLVEGSEAAGTLRADLAADWGVSRDVIVAGGAGDNAAAACGIGALNEGQGFVSLGTSGVLLLAREGYAPAAESAVHTFCHAVPDRWYQMGVMLSATDCLNWLSRITGRSPAVLTADLGPPQLPGRVRFLPYLSGERTPHNDPNIRGSFTGIDTNTSVHDMVRAVLWGVTFGMRDLQGALDEAGGKSDTLFAIGGGAASAHWLTLIASALGVKLSLPSNREFGAALGAARLAMIATGAGTVEEVIIPPQIGSTVLPDVRLMANLDDAYQQHRTSYQGIRAVQ